MRRTLLTLGALLFVLCGWQLDVAVVSATTYPNGCTYVDRHDPCPWRALSIHLSDLPTGYRLTEEFTAATWHEYTFKRPGGRQGQGTTIYDRLLGLSTPPKDAHQNYLDELKATRESSSGTPTAMPRVGTESAAYLGGKHMGTLFFVFRRGGHLSHIEITPGIRAKDFMLRLARQVDQRILRYGCIPDLPRIYCH